MYDNNFPPLTFADLSKAVQRESWGGLGQVDLSFPYADASSDSGSFLQMPPPGVGINTPGATDPAPGIVLSNYATPSSSGLTLTTGMGIAIAVVAGIILMGGRR